MLYEAWKTHFLRLKKYKIKKYFKAKDLDIIKPILLYTSCVTPRKEYFL